MTSWADDESVPDVDPQGRDAPAPESGTETAVPAATVSDPGSEPPAETAGTANEEEYPPGVVPAGQPAPEPRTVGAGGGIWLKVSGPHSGLEVIGAAVGTEYSEFTEDQATRLHDAAIAQGVTLIGKSDEEEANGEAVS